MTSLVILYTSYFIIYSCFICLYDSIIPDNCKYANKNFIDFIRLGVGCFVIFLGGVLATFVMSASVLILISMIFFVSGFIITMFIHQTIYWCWLSMISNSVSFGLFKFIFLVLILDQNSRFSVKIKVAGWFVVEYLSYLLVYLVFPEKIEDDYIKTALLILCLVAIALMLEGYLNNLYQIDSDKINILQLRNSLTSDETIFEKIDPSKREGPQIIVSISKSIIVLFLLLPFGISNYQESFLYQYKNITIPNPIYYAMKKKYFWCNTLESATILIYLLTIWALKYSKYDKLKHIYSNVSLKIILGNFLMIISTLTNGIISHLHTIHEGIKLTSFMPQMITRALAEALVVLTCAEILYVQSVRSTKYLSIAFLISAVAEQGIPALVSIPLNVWLSDVNSCMDFAHKLEVILFSLSGLALISLIISIYLMKRFKYYFRSVSITIQECQL